MLMPCYFQAMCYLVCMSTTGATSNNALLLGISAWIGAVGAVGSPEISQERLSFTFFGVRNIMIWEFYFLHISEIVMPFYLLVAHNKYRLWEGWWMYLYTVSLYGIYHWMVA